MADNIWLGAWKFVGYECKASERIGLMTRPILIDGAELVCRICRERA